MTAEEAGIAFVPNALVSMVVAPIAGRLTDRINGKYILGFGLTLFAIGMGLVIFAASLHSTGLSFTLPLIVSGIGMGCTFAPMVTMAMRNIAPQQAGAASGFINTMRQVGGAMGGAVVGAVLQNRLGSELHSQAVRFSAQLPASARARFVAGFSHATKSGLQVGRGQTGAAGNLPGNLPASVAHQLAVLGRETFQNAYLNAMKPSLALPIVVIFCGAAVTQLMRSGSGTKGQDAAAEARRPAGVTAAGD